MFSMKYLSIPLGRMSKQEDLMFNYWILFFDVPTTSSVFFLYGITRFISRVGEGY
jgi:hypothetical protein